MAMQLANEVVSNASVDLEGFDAVSSKTPSLTNGAVLKGGSKKRKHASNSGAQAENSAVEVGVPHNHSLKIAALEALETLLTIGGALGSNGWRERVDKLLMTTAKNACEGRWANSETYHHLPNKSSTDLVEFKLAALRSFLASLVSPSPVRPAFLAEGLELFQRGKCQAEMKVAEFCAHALMSLEVVIHPRALPLDGLPSLSSQFPQSDSLASQKHNAPGLNKMDRIAGDGSVLSNLWLANVDVPANSEIERTVDTTLPLPEAKRLKVGNDLVGSENVQHADVLIKVPESTKESLVHVSERDDDMVPKVVSETQEGESLAGKDSLMEEAAVGKKHESLGESDDDSIPSLKADDYLSSDSDIES